jgi:hypothetical protein
MLPGFKPLKLYKGDTFSFRLTLNSGTDPYDITSHTFICQIKEKNKSAVVAEFDYQIEDANDGIVLLTLSSTESSKLIGGRKYVYDIQMDNDGDSRTIINGPIIVVSDVSS